MRVALGGVLVADVGMSRRLGARLDDRLGWLRDQILGLRYKIESLAGRWAEETAR
jgi:hypothetical protein